MGREGNRGITCSRLPHRHQGSSPCRDRHRRGASKRSEGTSPVLAGAVKNTSTAAAKTYDKDEKGHGYPGLMGVMF